MSELCHCGKELRHRGNHLGAILKRGSERKGWAPREGSNPPGPQPSVDLATYAALFYCTDPVTHEPMNNTEIAAALGISRERVRQIRAKHFPHLGSIRTVKKAITRQKRSTKRFRSLSAFRLMVRRWLLAAGYGQCCRCKAVKCLDGEIVRNHNRKCPTSVVCHSCNAASANQHYYNGGSAVQAKWRSENRDKTRVHCARYQEKKRSKGDFPNALRCAACSRVIGGDYHDRSRPHVHKRPDGAWCDGSKVAGIPLTAATAGSPAPDQTAAHPPNLATQTQSGSGGNAR